MSRRRLIPRALTWLFAALVLYGVAAYVAAPDAWRLFGDQKLGPRVDMLTRTSAGIAGDPINLGFVAPKETLLRAFAAAGWHPADPLTLRTAYEIGIDVVLDRPYAGAPVSPLYFEGRRQDLAFEKPIGDSPDQRHHLRVWNIDDGPGFWLGAATLDRSVGFSHDTGQITHHIAPDIDAERDLVVSDLTAGGTVAETYAIDGAGATSDGRNGEGDPYFTDGSAAVVVFGGTIR